MQAGLCVFFLLRWVKMQILKMHLCLVLVRRARLAQNPEFLRDEYLFLQFVYQAETYFEIRRQHSVKIR